MVDDDCLFPEHARVVAHIKQNWRGLLEALVAHFRTMPPDDTASLYFRTPYPPRGAAGQRWFHILFARAHFEPEVLFVKVRCSAEAEPNLENAMGTLPLKGQTSLPTGGKTSGPFFRRSSFSRSGRPST
jgi:hypothetical protein